MSFDPINIHLHNLEFEMERLNKITDNVRGHGKTLFETTDDVD